MTPQEIKKLQSGHTYTEAMLLAQTLDRIVPEPVGKQFVKLAKDLQAQRAEPRLIIQTLLGSGFDWYAYGN